MKLKLFVLCCFLTLLLCVVRSDDDERTLSMKLNPGCADQLETVRCEGLSFLHVEAVSSNNSLHYLWDFTGIPSFFLARTPHNSSLLINWSDFMKGSQNSVSFTKEPEFAFSAVIHKFLLFNDADDKGNVNEVPADRVISFNPQGFEWSRVNLTGTQEEVTMLMNTTVDNGDEGNGSFVVKVSAFGSTKHGAELPHLYHSAHSMQLDIVAENITSNFTKPRIAVSFLLVSSENKTEGVFHLNKRRNLDDEFTPGVFDVFDIVSPRSANGSQGAFLQYRPVCYTTPERTVSGSTQLSQGEIKSFADSEKEIDDFKYTLPFSYYGYKLGVHVAQGTNITFGTSGDGFYSRSNFTSFSMLLGSGAPPIERLSNFVITFASIGLGVPLLVLLVGGITVCVKRYRN